MLGIVKSGGCNRVTAQLIALSDTSRQIEGRVRAFTAQFVQGAERLGHTCDAERPHQELPSPERKLVQQSAEQSCMMAQSHLLCTAPGTAKARSSCTTCNRLLKSLLSSGRDSSCDARSGDVVESRQLLMRRDVAPPG